MKPQLIQLWCFVLLLVPLPLTEESSRNGELPLKRDRHDVQNITITSNSLFCLPGILPEEDSYHITAQGTTPIHCPLVIKDIDSALVRFQSNLAFGETVHFVGLNYNISVTSDSPLGGCYFLRGENIYMYYYKMHNVTPSLNVMITKGECREPDETCDVSCRIDGCVTSEPSPYCNIVCIDDDYRCNGLQHCPYGEDESCGQISTITPASDSPTPPPTGPTPPSLSSYPPTTIAPSHVRPIIFGPNMEGCAGVAKSYVNQEIVFASRAPSTWTGVCRYVIYSSNQGDDERHMTVIRLETGLGTSESITIIGGNGNITINHRTIMGECFITTGAFTLVYQCRTGYKHDWKLISTPIDCDEDYYCPVRCNTKLCYHGTKEACPNSGCIRNRNRCDGLQQCPLGEDETCGDTVIIVPPQNGRGIHGGIIFVIVIAIIVAVVTVIGGAVYFIRRSKRQNPDPFWNATPVEELPQHTPPPLPTTPIPNDHTRSDSNKGKKSNAAKDDDNIYEVS